MPEKNLGFGKEINENIKMFKSQLDLNSEYGEKGLTSLQIIFRSRSDPERNPSTTKAEEKL